MVIGNRNRQRHSCQKVPLTANGEDGADRGKIGSRETRYGAFAVMHMRDRAKVRK